MFLDIHSHVLFGVDDGAKTIEESLELLRLVKSQGTDAIIATPHFFPNKETASAKKDIIIRNHKELWEAAKGEIYPELFLGYEVSFFYGISNYESLDELTLGGSDKILIELPFSRITDKVAYELEEIAFSRKLTPILAHIERYRSYEGIEKIDDLIYNDVVRAQTTSSCAVGFSNKRDISRLLEKGIITYFGSDAHNMTARPPHNDKFLKFAQKKHYPFYEKMLESNKRLYNSMIK